MLISFVMRHNETKCQTTCQTKCLPQIRDDSSSWYHSKDLNYIERTLHCCIVLRDWINDLYALFHIQRENLK